MTADREEQEDELLALQSIFDSEEFVRDEPKFSGEIRVSVELPAGFSVALREGETFRTDEISFLPPLCLTFDLPEDYPSSSPPTFTLTCSWLTDAQLSALSSQLADLYLATGGAVVLFTWVQFLKEDALEFLDIRSLLELPSDEQSSEPDISVGGDLTDGETPPPADGSSKDSQEEEEEEEEESASVNENRLNSELEEIQNTPEAEEAIKSSGSQADSTDPPPAESDQSDPDKTFGGGDSSASGPPSSASTQTEEAGAASPRLPKMNPKREYRSPCGVSLSRSQALLSELLVFDAAQRQKAFEVSVFHCGVCFMGLLGSDCVQIPGCGHVFCRSCLGEFCKVQITEGTVQRVGCLDPDCSESPTPAQVRSLVGEELFSRYDRLLLQTSLDGMADVTYCPRRTCGSAVIVEKSSRAAMCFACDFAFCVACRKTYHGTKDCQREKKTKEETNYTEDGTSLPRTKEGLKALWDDYASGSKGRKQLLERRYGRSRLLFTTQEFLSEEWITEKCKNCPHCFRRIQKISGCNSMICSQCKRRFCWACLTKLDLPETLSHFSTSPECTINMYTYEE